MTKAELVAQIAKLDGMENQKDAENALNGVIIAISNLLKAGDSINIPNFGTFSVKDRAARKGRNPATGAEMDIPATKVVHFSPSKSLKEAVAGK